MEVCEAVAPIKRARAADKNHGQVEGGMYLPSFSKTLVALHEIKQELNLYACDIEQ
jgi:hypothetical protein